MDKKVIVSVAIIISISVIVGIIAKYTEYQKKENVKKFEKYLLENEFIKQKDGSYTKTTDENDNMIKYYYIKDENLLTKEITTPNNELFSIKYEDGKIYGRYTKEGMLNAQYVSTIQRGTYDLKTKKYTCKIITNNKAEPKCNKIRNQILKYKKEIDEINKNKINIKYIN